MSEITVGGVVLAFAALAGCGGDGNPAAGPTSPAVPGGAWSAAAPMLEARQEVCVAAVGARIYVAGGFRANGSTTAALEAYDTATDRWTMLAPMPEAPPVMKTARPARLGYRARPGSSASFGSAAMAIGPFRLAFR